MAFLKYVFAIASLFTSAFAIVGVQWAVPNGQFTYVKSTVTVPDNLVMGDNVYVYGFVSTSLQGTGVYIADGNVYSSGNLTPDFPTHSLLGPPSIDGDTLWPGDKVTNTYTKNLSTGIWTIVTSVTRGPAGTAAGGLPLSYTTTDNGSANVGGSTVATIVELGSLVYSGAPVTRKITWNDITFRSTSSDATWCKAYTLNGAPNVTKRNFTLVGGAGKAIAGGTECTFSTVSFLDPPGQ